MLGVIDSQAWKPATSLGIEYRPSLCEFIRKEHATLGHVQLTIPNDFFLSKVLDNPPPQDIVVHSNLLHVFSKSNDWETLKRAAKQLRKLRPQHVLEHFSNGSSPSGERGFFFPDEADLEVALENLARWQDLLGSPIMVENIPLTTDAHRYFELFQTICVKSEIGMGLDLPHFFITTLTCGFSEQEAFSLLKELHPIQIHLSAVSIRSSRLVDNHKRLDPWMVHTAATHFPNAQFVTFEQHPSMSKEQLEKFLPHLIEPNDGKAIDFSHNFTPYDFNEDFRQTAEDYFFSGRLSKPQSIQPRPKSFLDFKHKDSPLALFENYYPYWQPLSWLANHSAQLTCAQVIELASSLCQQAFALSSWFGPPSKAIFLSCAGANGKNLCAEITSSSISVSTPTTPVVEEIPLDSSDGNPIRILITEKPKKEENNERRNVRSVA